MASTLSRFREWATNQRNVVIYAAIVLAFAAGYGFAALFHPDGSFLALALVGIVVPGVYDRSWPQYDRTATAVAWIVAASAIAFAAYVGLYVLGADAFSMSPLVASAVAFLVTGLTASAVGSVLGYGRSNAGSRR